MKMYRSAVLNNLDQFKFAKTPSQLMRLPLEMFLFWKIVEYTKPDSVLEIGTFAGQTLGLMIEASGKTAETYTSVDVCFDHMTNFKSLFSDITVEYIETDSMELNLTKKYDLIHIDGDHRYEFVSNDIKKIIPCLHNNSILIFDDYNLPGVDQAIDEFLLSNTGFVPFMHGHQSMFFHHYTQSLDFFLDEYIYKNSVNDFIDLSNADYKGHTVLKGNLPNVFVKHHHLFLETLKLYDI
jgi:predicted O-methyltransferase YrrM